MHACVRACVPLTCAKSVRMCAQVCISRMRNATIHHGKNTAHWTTGDKPPLPPPSCRRRSQRVDYISSVPFPAAAIAESRLCTESFLKIICSDRSRNSRGSNKIILSWTIRCLPVQLPSFRLHAYRRELPLVLYHTVLFSCGYKRMLRRRKMITKK